ncbi:MAG: alpha/beta fold hydrolase [Planctomycetota bacterium]|nr:alpha/beta fold hydrolase [Planctomycetota bacterium]
MAWFIVACLIALTITLIVIQLAISRSVMRMIENAPPLNPGEFGSDPRAKELSFRTDDGMELQACHFRHEDRVSRGLILFCHELGGNRWSAMSYCEGLFEAGFEILAFDFRNHGTSDRQAGYQPLHWLTEFELIDVRGALKLIQQREELSHQPLGVFGISRGGVSALAATAESNDVECVACDGAYSTRSMMSLFSQRWVSLLVPQWMSGWIPAWHIEVSLFGGRIYSEFRRKCRYVHLEQYLPALRDRPVLLISGAQDNYVRPGIAKLLQKGIGEDTVDLWVVPKARHNGARQTDQEGYDQRLTEFFGTLVPVQFADSTDKSTPVSEALT